MADELYFGGTVAFWGTLEGTPSAWLAQKGTLFRRTKSRPMTSKEKARKIVEFAEEMKAEGVETLDVRAKTSLADYFVVCGGTSDRHVQSIAERVSEKLRQMKVRPLHVEGERTGWVLLDYGDVVLHVMREEQRQFYDLETLWKSRGPDPNLAP